MVWTWNAISAYRFWPIAYLTIIAESLDPRILDHLARVGKKLVYHGQLNCSCEGDELEGLNAIRRHGLPNTCFGAGFARAFCCVSRESSFCFKGDEDEYSFDNCCAGEDTCTTTFEVLLSNDATQFDSCDYFLSCAGRIFLPCIVWTLEYDHGFEKLIVPRLLNSGRVRCFSIFVHAEPETPGEPPVLGVDVWVLGVCLPLVCTAAALQRNLRRVFEAVPLSRITGMRIRDFDEARTVGVEELLHWSQLHIDFAIVGAPNSGSTSLHNTLMMHHQVNFVDDLSEFSMPVSRYRSEDDWGWRCSAPALVSWTWANQYQLILERGHRRRKTKIGIRNPTLIYANQCLKHISTIPGIRIIIIWRDPLDWIKSSLLRSVDGFNVSKQLVELYFEGIASPKQADDSIPLSKTGGGLREISLWRLGVPVAREHALLAREIRSVAGWFGRKRLAIVDFEWLRNENACLARRMITKVHAFLGLRPLIPARNSLTSRHGCSLISYRRFPKGLSIASENIRRRRSSVQESSLVSNPVLDLCGAPSVRKAVKLLESYFDSENKARAILISEYGVLRTRESIAIRMLNTRCAAGKMQ